MAVQERQPSTKQMWRSVFFLTLSFFTQSRGHKEDILCIAQCPPTLLATSSYDGEIIVWNMISGRIRHKFHTPILTSSVYTKSKCYEGSNNNPTFPPRINNVCMNHWTWD